MRVFRGLAQIVVVPVSLLVASRFEARTLRSWLVECSVYNVGAVTVAVGYSAIRKGTEEGLRKTLMFVALLAGTPLVWLGFMVPQLLGDLGPLVPLDALRLGLPFAATVFAEARELRHVYAD